MRTGVALNVECENKQRVISMADWVSALETGSTELLFSAREEFSMDLVSGEILHSQ